MTYNSSSCCAEGHNFLFWCRAAEATAAEARRKYEAAKLAADEAEKARLAAEGLNEEVQARMYYYRLLAFDMCRSVAALSKITHPCHHHLHATCIMFDSKTTH